MPDVMTQGVNLIPTPRRSAKRRRMRVRWCMAACAAYAALAVAAAGTCRVVWGAADDSIDRQLVSTSEQIDRATKLLNSTVSELVELRRVDGDSRHILGQPDWSLLLVIVAEQTGDDIVLQSCTLRSAGPVDKSNTGKTPAAPNALVVTCAGLGKSNIAVSQFVLRMERTKLFSKVALVDSTRQAAPGGEAFSFKIECPLEAKPTPSRPGEP